MPYCKSFIIFFKNTNPQSLGWQTKSVSKKRLVNYDCMIHQIVWDIKEMKKKSIVKGVPFSVVSMNQVNIREKQMHDQLDYVPPCY